MDSLGKVCVLTYVTDSNFCIVVGLIFGYACLSRYGSYEWQFRFIWPSLSILC